MPAPPLLTLSDFSAVAFWKNIPPKYHSVKKRPEIENKIASTKSRTLTQMDRRNSVKAIVGVKGNSEAILHIPGIRLREVNKCCPISADATADAAAAATVVVVQKKIQAPART